MVDYEGWDREYLENREEYLRIFDKFMMEGKYDEPSSLEEVLSQSLGRKHVVAVSSATDALKFSLLALGIQPGDEVLVSDFSWISTASCISMVGATPVFCDIDLDTYHICLSSIEKMVSEKTKALIYTHLFGNMTDCSDIMDFCAQRGIAFVEDAAQSLGASLNGVQAGTLGDCSSFSFNSNKVIAGINGGGVYMTDIDDCAERVRRLRRHGKADDFGSLGYNARLYGLNERIILFRLEKIMQQQARRNQIADMYDRAFGDLPLKLQKSPAGLRHNRHKYTVRFANKETRNKVKRALSASVHYERPLSSNSMYQAIPHRKDLCKNARQVSDTILSLPIHSWLKEEEVLQVCKIVSDNV